MFLYIYTTCISRRESHDLHAAQCNEANSRLGCRDVPLVRQLCHKSPQMGNVYERAFRAAIVMTMHGGFDSNGCRVRGLCQTGRIKEAITAITAQDMEHKCIYSFGSASSFFLSLSPDVSLYLSYVIM